MTTGKTDKNKMNKKIVWQKFRQKAALFAMAGLLADPEPRPQKKRRGESCASAVARISLEHADALIKELQKSNYLL